MRVPILITAVVISFTASSCSRGISGVNSNDPYIAEQAQKAQQLQNDVDNQKKIVDTEKQRLKALEYQLDGAKKNLKGRKLATKV
jgi:outer membrane lipoprotein SlyB